jgi:hypothetical protein
MKNAFGMGSGAMIYIPSFIKIGSGIQKLFLKFASCCMYTNNIYKFYHQHDNYFYIQTER